MTELGKMMVTAEIRWRSVEILTRIENESRTTNRKIDELKNDIAGINHIFCLNF